MDKKSAKRLAKKTLHIRESRFAQARSLSYNDAMTLVRGLRKAGRYADAKSALEQICDQVSFVAEPHLYLLNICLDGMWMDQAEALVDFTLKSFPRDNQVISNCVRFYRVAGDIDSARALLARAVKLHPGNDENYASLGLVYKSSGDTQSALAAFNKALARNARNVAALEGKLGIQGAQAGAEVISAVEDMLQAGRFSDFDRAGLHSALAEVYAQSDLEMHFMHLHHANRLVAAWRPYDAERDKAKAQQMMQRFSAENVARTGAVSAETLSPVFIISMPRSGTTLLERMLGAHSRLNDIGESGAFQLALENPAEHAEFGSVLHMPDIDQNQSVETVKAYCQEVSQRFRNNFFVRRVTQGQLVDKSIENFYLVGCILLVFPNARIIDLQRHPLDLIYSCYRQNFAAGVNFSFDLEHLAQKYLLYLSMMQHWRELYGDRILSVSYESLVTEPEPVLRSILDYSGLDWESACLDFRKNTSVVNTASDVQVRKPLYRSSVYGWERVKDYLQPAIATLGEAVNYTPKV